jgi:IS1 family transposase
MEEIEQISMDEQWTYLNCRVGQGRNSVWIASAISKSKQFSTLVLGSRTSETIDNLLDKCPVYATSVSDNFRGYYHLDNHSLDGKRGETNINESWNMRIRHYLARMKRKTLCYSKSLEMLYLSFTFIWVRKFWNINLS